MKNILIAMLVGIFAVFTVNAQSITSAEYFFDTDPGLGQGTPYSLTAGSTVTLNNESVITDCSNLESGVHLFCFRYRDSAGAWSHTQCKTVVLSGGVATEIVAAEYFIDTEPGIGNGTPFNLNPNASIDLNEAIATPDCSNLESGVHLFCFRYQDDAGAWSHTQCKTFVLSGGIATEIVAAEYFFDTDPGVGNGTALDYVDVGATSDNAFAVDVASLSTGSHLLCHRYQDDSGSWSHTQCETFTVSAPTGFTGTADYDFTYQNPTDVAFTDASTGATSWYWDFGDGTTSTEQNPTHSFTQPGIYHVCLFIDGCQSSVQTIVICSNGLVPGEACADDNECTENELVAQTCECQGTIIDNDNDGVCNANDCDDNNNMIGEVGTACDDGDICTINDILQVDCTCAGTFADADNDGTCDTEDICADSPEPGTTCDDGDACTVNDVIQADCSCAGTFADADNDGICDAEDVCAGSPEPNTPCDDGDICTVNDIIQADCTCAGVYTDTDNDGTCDAEDVCADSPEPNTPCDDGDVCTVNDVIQSDCTCAGTFVDADNDSTCDAEDICADSPEPGTACDDGNDATFNDVIQADCTCAGSEQDCEGVVGGSANEGTPCDDGDTCTENDVYQADCSCAGTPIDADNDGAVCADDCDDNDASIGAVGSACDDGDACTVNDVIQSDCTCAGTFADADNDGTCDAEDVCADAPEPGTACDDGNPATFNDTIQSDCTCAGSEQDCEGVVGGSANEGSPCDDGDVCTENDVYQADCLCTGTPIDADNDGAVCADDCDDNDASIGAVGSTCDDGDACTINDIIQSDCSCAGTFADADNDGTCDAEDICADAPEPGTACDDGDAATSNDMIQADCSCMGSLLDCAGIAGGSNTEDECGVCDDDPTNDNETCTDCAGIINGDAELDECGVCEGTGIATGTCDCAGTPETTFYADTDNDSLGDPESSLMACEQPEGYVTNSDDLDDTFDDSFCEEPVITTTTECLENGGFTILITIEETGTNPTLFILDNSGSVPAIVSSDEGTIAYGEYENNEVVELTVATGANCDGYSATLTDNCIVEPPACTLIAEPMVNCNQTAGIYNVVVAVTGGSGNYAYAFGENAEYEDLSGSTEAGFISGNYTDGETYYISIIDTDSDCEVILSSFVECTKTAIELLSFNGRANENNNQLFWTTASETDNDYFDIMRSKDGVNFESIGKVNGVGNTSTPTNYEFVDTDISVVKTFYRLDAIDSDGKASSSNIIALNRELMGQISVVPNPASDFINISVSITPNTALHIKLFDVQGKLVLVKTVDHISANICNLNISTLSNGLYFLQLENNGVAHQAKFIVK